MRRAVVGIAAHVDAGKTTLCEAMLYRAGDIRRLGRVDHGDAFLDTDAMEKRRGITIFSKQAILRHGDFEFTLLDTPGHVDFSAETERTLTVLDYAILVVGADDGLQGHTETLWRLLARYHVPTFVFINKMDAAGASKSAMMERMRRRFGEGCIDFQGEEEPGGQEEVALLDESGTAMDELLDGGVIGDDTLRSMVASRRIFPCYSGSALKLEGIDEFLAGLERFTRSRDYDDGFGARVYKVSHDGQGNRLTWLKVTGGTLKVKDVLTNAHGGDAGGDAVAADGADIYDVPGGLDADGTDVEIWREKVDQIRRYSGAKFELADEVSAGDVCAVTGLTKTVPGEGLGEETNAGAAVLRPVLTYTVLPGKAGDTDGEQRNDDATNDGAASSAKQPAQPSKPAEITPEQHGILVALRTLEDEDPALDVRWVARLGEIRVRLMGEVQVEIITQMLHDRFGLDVHFGPGGILYRETIAAPVEGIGHFEPLRHYAEVHLLLEPGEPGSGLWFASHCSLDDLDRNWQRAVLTHLREKEHLGVLTGAPITDMTISLIAGRGHDKHTEGGDFREATYRAVRQGLMELKAQGNCRLLEPFYRFRLEVPQEMLGRAMADIQRMSGTFEAPQSDGDYAGLEGDAPVAEMNGYAMDVNAYTHGRGSLTCVFAGYRPCHDAERVIAQAGYDPETDLENTPDSVFCAHGAGYTVKWNKVPDFAHLGRVLPR
ncbi:TetM/TetW/TetO/TetS family tetracycline resistance ribosomal protection protein [Bifidobacterium sp. ESL0763]|uniref:GTP-binding protein n=1 Tax=Bifidobacterium sp. ESL0763 TaxID=2983227 RepID=UPI0023F9421F|nr:TetM/TetW/TetO/TetS family tetracycline resistance ribosomal protection protein [Bifidobacterium sp. ESL0763]MDF7664225.1 TetM/TetW/TetO/TetS family tetracycline resistance ribosomal protection protein [Bifidobacterium sp. ESL0763]